MIDALRFWRHVEVESNDCEACWIWVGAMRDDGRGRFWHDGKEIRAHWAAWEIRFGEAPPKGYRLRQKCERFDCVRHWDLGGKVRKLSAADIKAILTSTLGYRALGKRFGVHRNSIRWHRQRTDWATQDDRGGSYA